MVSYRINLFFSGICYSNSHSFFLWHRIHDYSLLFIFLSAEHPDAGMLVLVDGYSNAIFISLESKIKKTSGERGFL